MTLHLHSEYVEGCYRCDLGRDEAARAQAELISDLRRLVALQDAYVDFLNEANKGPISNAWVHGWRCPQADIDRGEEFRQQIDELRDCCGVTDDAERR